MVWRQLILTLYELLLEQFLIVQESEYFQGLHLGIALPCFISYTPNNICDEDAASASASRRIQVFYSLLDAVRARCTYRVVRYSFIPARPVVEISNKWSAFAMS